MGAREVGTSPQGWGAGEATGTVARTLACRRSGAPSSGLRAPALWSAEGGTSVAHGGRVPGALTVPVGGVGPGVTTRDRRDTWGRLAVLWEGGMSQPS